MAIHLEVVHHGGLQSCRQSFCGGRLRPIGQNDAEFIAPQPRQERTRSRILQSPGQLAQQSIADRMAEDIVDLLEPVKIDADDGNCSSILGGIFDCFEQKLIERSPVWQIC